MLSFHKRKVIILISLILSFILCIIFCACGGSRDNDNAFLLDGLVVKFLDVGEGDATIIRLPDGKVMLFDTGANTKNNKEKVISSLKDCKNELDYLVLSHPD